MVAGGKATKVTIESGKQEGVPCPGEMTLNRAKERGYMFGHA